MHHYTDTHVTKEIPEPLLYTNMLTLTLLKDSGQGCITSYADANETILMGYLSCIQ